MTKSQSPSQAQLLARRRRQMQLARLVGQTIATTTTLAELYRQIVTQVKEQFHYHHTQLFRYNADNQSLTMVAAYGLADEVDLSADQPCNADLLNRAIQSQQTILLSNLSVLDWQPPAALASVQGELIVPISMGEKLWGLLDVYSDVPGLLDADDQLILEGLCGQIAVVIEATTQRQKLEENLQELDALQRLTTIQGWQAFQQGQAHTCIGYEFLQQTLTPIFPDSEVSHIPADSHPSVLTQPLTVRGHRIGYLGVSFNPDETPSVEEQILLEGIAQQVSAALERARLMEQTNRQAAQAALRERYQKGVAHAATLLNERGTEAMPVVLRRLGQTAQVNRVYYFETRADAEENEYWTLLAEWHTPGLADRLEDPTYQRFSVENLPYIAAQLRQEGQVVGVVSDMPEQEQAVFEPLHTKSIACFAVPGKWDTPGMLGFDDTMSERLWLPEELDALQSVVTALTNTIVLEDILRQMQESMGLTRTLYLVSQRLNAAADYQQILAGVVDVPPVHNTMNRAVLFLFDHDDAGLVERITLAANWYSGQGPSPLPVGLRYTQSDFPSLDIYLRPETLVIDDVQAAPNIDDVTKSLLRQQQVHALVALPLTSGERRLGALILQNDAPHAFNSHEVQYYQAVISAVSIAVENKRLLLQTQETLTDLEAIQRRYTLEAWQRHRATHSGQLSAGYHPAGEAPSAAIPDKAVQQAIRQKQTIIVDHTLPAQANDTPDTPAASLVVPLVLRDEVIGVVGFAHVGDDALWLPEEVALVEAVATEFVQAAEELRLLEQIQRHAWRDRAISEVTASAWASPEITDVLQAAVTQLAEKLHASEVIIRLDTEAGDEAE